MHQPNPLRHERRINGATVRAIRGLRGETQDEVATAADLSFTTISHIEAGRRQPTWDVTVRIANALEVHPDAISYVTAIYVADESARPVGVVCSADGTAA